MKTMQRNLEKAEMEQMKIQMISKEKKLQTGKIKVQEKMKILEGLDDDWEDLKNEKIKICHIKSKLEKDLEEARNTLEIEKTQMDQSRIKEEAIKKELRLEKKGLKQQLEILEDDRKQLEEEKKKVELEKKRKVKRLDQRWRKKFKKCRQRKTGYSRRQTFYRKIRNALKRTGTI